MGTPLSDRIEEEVDVYAFVFNELGVKYQPVKQVSAPKEGRLNVLLLGGDAGPGRIGLRPDSMTLVSIDAASGRSAMFSFAMSFTREMTAAFSSRGGESWL